MDKLLFTGGTGFLGKNIRPILDKMYEVTTCGITSEDMVKTNLAKEVPRLEQHYDVVLHACVRLMLYLRLKQRNRHFLM